MSQFKVVVNSKEIACIKSLSEACQIYIREVKELIGGGCHSATALREGCMIETNFDGKKYTMDFHDITEYSNAIGLLDERGELIDKVAPYIPNEIERAVFIAAFRYSLSDYLEDNAGALAWFLDAAEPRPETEPNLVTE